MSKSIAALFFGWCLFGVSSGLAQTAARPASGGEDCKKNVGEIARLKTETLDSFRRGDYDAAHAAARQALNLAEKFCADEAGARLQLAMNFAEIQIKREKRAEAREIFAAYLPLAETVYGEKSPKLNTHLNMLIRLSRDDVDNAKFEQYLLKSLKIKKELFGEKSYEAMVEMILLAEFYEKTKEREKVEPLYLAAAEINAALPLDEKTRKVDVLNRYRSYLTRNFGDEGTKKADEFIKRYMEENRIEGDDSSGILNGRATILYRPVYPAAARNMRAAGLVKVSITIDETGKVIRAEAVSGHKLLQEPSVEAARKSLFSPTYKDGKPVKVTGIIVFHFALP